MISEDKLCLRKKSLFLITDSKWLIMNLLRTADIMRIRLGGELFVMKRTACRLSTVSPTDRTFPHFGRKVIAWINPGGVLVSTGCV